MTSDSIERILSDCTRSPEAYCHLYGCGQGIYDELADYVPDMCVHLVGRTEAVMRHNMPVICDSNEWHVGDKVMRRNGRTGEVIGFAVGKDGKHCLALSMHDGPWKTYLCPIDEAVHMQVPSQAYVSRLIERAIKDAADYKGDGYRDAEAIAGRIMGVARASFEGRPFPVEELK